MKKSITFCLISFFFVSLFAQVSVNPNDKFYEKAMIWEIKGLVNDLPQIRPYSLPVVEKILKEVIESDSEIDSEAAKLEYERISGRPWHFQVSTDAVYIKTSSGSEKILDGDFHFQGDNQLFKYAGLSYNLGLLAILGNEFDKKPLWNNIDHDSVQDAVGFGPIDGFVDGNCNIFFGNQVISGTAGINRFGFGPFWQEGLAMNDSAYHSSGLSYTLNFAPGFTFSQLFSSIGATNNIGTELFSSKFVSLHSLRWSINKKISLTYYENVVFGRRTELSYLFPVPYMINQGINGCNDNLQMGVIFETRPFDGLKISGDLFVDDFSLRFRGLDDKYRVAGILGAQYAPELSWLTLVDVNYTAVMPFVYSHWDYDDYKSFGLKGRTINYQNYSNNGFCMGSALEGDSDRVKLKIKSNPVENLELNFTAAFTRHQNVCEAFTEEEALYYLSSEPGHYRTDGSIFTHQMLENDDRTKDHFPNKGIAGFYLDSAWDHLLFMKGEHTMTDLTFGFDAEYTLNKNKAGTFKIGLGYDFEYIRNAGINNDLYPGQGKDKLKRNDDGSYTWNGMENVEGSEIVKYYKDSWEKQLYNISKHFISLHFTYTW